MRRKVERGKRGREEEGKDEEKRKMTRTSRRG